MGTSNRDRRRQKKRRQVAAERARRRRGDSDSSAASNSRCMVAGERVGVLLEALLRFKWRTRPDGMVSMSARLEPELGAPLERALMRIQAELLLADAEIIGTDVDEHRTHDQRAADALVELVQQVTNRRAIA